MRAAATALATLAALTLCAASPLPDGWTVFPTPEPNACEWQRANYSKREWRVRLEDERLIIEPASAQVRAMFETPTFDIPRRVSDPPYAKPCEHCVMRVADGWLVGFNFGEWGGGLWWTDTEGKNANPVMTQGRCADIADTGPPFWNETPGETWQVTNVVALHDGNERAFAFAGLAHLSLSTGELNRLERHNGIWRACVVRNLEGAPLAVVADAQGTWLALTAKGIGNAGGLVRVDTAGNLRRLYEPAFNEGGLYPNSMVKLRDGTLYVGMRHFVARLTPDPRGGYTEELLIPKDRPPFDFEPSIDDPNYPYGGQVPNCPRPGQRNP